MKTTMLSVIGCALLAAGALEARAQSTNVTFNVNIALTGVTGGGSNGAPTRVKIGTKDVINALATDLGISVSSKARLMAVDDGSGGGPSFIIRDAGTDTAVPSSNLGTEELAAVDNTKETGSGAITGQRTSIDHFVLNTSSISFDVQGYTTQSVSNHGTGRNLLNDAPPVSLNSKVNGVANGGDPVNGIISASGRRVEVTQ